MRIGMLTLCVLAMGLLVGACNKSDKKAQKKSCDALCTRFNVTCAKENMLLTIKDNDTYKKAKPDKQKLMLSAAINALKYQVKECKSECTKKPGRFSIKTSKCLKKSDCKSFLECWNAP